MGNINKWSIEKLTDKTVSIIIILNKIDSLDQLSFIFHEIMDCHLMMSLYLNPFDEKQPH